MNYRLVCSKPYIVNHKFINNLCIALLVMCLVERVEDWNLNNYLRIVHLAYRAGLSVHNSLARNSLDLACGQGTQQ